MRKKNRKIFEKSKKIKAIQEVAIKTIGEEETERLWPEVYIIFAKLQDKYQITRAKEQIHTDIIFSHIAVYKVLLEAYPNLAMKIMEDGEAIPSKKEGELFRKIVALPFCKALFFKCFDRGCKKYFGSEAGFENVVYTATTREYKMDMLLCPYLKYCNAEGCYELCHIFCNNDVYTYGNLKGISFKRTETLGMGGNKCDFWLRREK